MSSSANADDQFSVVRNFLNLGQIDEAHNNLQIATELDNLTERHLFVLNILKSKILLELGEISEAQVLVNYTIEKIDKRKFKVEYAEAKTVKAASLLFSGDLDLGLSELQEVETFISKLQEIDQGQSQSILGEVKNLLGLIYMTRGDLESAVTQYNLALSIHKKHNNQKDLGAAFFNLGTTYRLQNNLTNSISSTEDAILVFEEIDFADGLSNSYKLMRDVYADLGDDDNSFLFKQKFEGLQAKVDLRSQILQSTKERNKSSREIERLNRKILTYQQDNWTLKLEINSLNDTSRENSLLESLDFSDENSRLRTELEDAITLHDKTLIELADSKSRQNTIQNELNQLETQIVGSNMSSEETDKHKEEIENLKGEHVKIIETLQAEIDDLKKQTDSRTANSEELEKHKKEIQKLETLHFNANSYLKGEVEILKKQIEKSVKLDSNETALIQEIQDLKAQMTTKTEVSSDIGALEQKITTLEAENADLTTQLNSSQTQRSETDSASEELDALKKEHATAIEQLRTEHEAKIQKLVNISDMSNKFDPDEEGKLKTELEVANTKLDQLDNEKEELERLLDQQKVEISSKNSEVITLTDQLSTMKLEVVKLKKEKAKSVPSPPQVVEKTAEPSSFIKESEAAIINKVSPKLQARIRSSNPQTKLKEILESSKLAEEIAKVLQGNPKLKLRFLAMQIGTSPVKCLQELELLKAVDFLELQYDGHSDPNPFVILK